MDGRHTGVGVRRRDEGREIFSYERVAASEEVERVRLHEDEDVAYQHDRGQEYQDEEDEAKHNPDGDHRDMASEGRVAQGEPIDNSRTAKWDECD